jgi:hypothetical protein
LIAAFVLLATIATADGCRSSPFGRHAAAAPNAGMGTSLDDIDARNRADIANQLGRPVEPGPATPVEVAAMTHAGVEPRFIVSYINRSAGMQPINAQDVIYLHEQGVSSEVIQAMLTPGAAYPRTDVVRVIPAPRLVILADPYGPYGYPYYRYSYGYGCRCY